MARNVVLCGVALLLASSCTELVEPSSPYDYVGQPIVGGSPAIGAPYDAVVAITINVGGSQYLCSGTLISPDVVLTAAHCLDTGHGGTFKTVSPSQLRVIFGNTVSSGVSHTVSEALIDPTYNRRAVTDDIGLIRLSSPVSTTPVPWLPASLASREVVGTTVNFAGFGTTSANGPSGTKLQVDGVLSAVRTAELEYPQNEPAPDGSGPCFGDSGGPLFYDFDGTIYVGGTTSTGDAKCQVYGISMRVSHYDALIRDFVGVPECAGDGDCSDGNACTTDTCVSGSCQHTPLDCNDGDACTADSCSAGVCQHGAVNCDDGNVCTDDFCYSDQGCAHTDNTNACDDGDACTGNDVCSSGTCQGTPQCTCGGRNAFCSSNADCCSGNCHRNRCH